VGVAPPVDLLSAISSPWNVPSRTPSLERVLQLTVCPKKG